jgi:hypothetical protein
MHFLVFEYSTYDTIYTSLLIVALGALLLQFKRGDEPGRWARRLGTGLALGLLYNTRPDRPWVMLLIIIFLGAGAIRVWPRYPTVATRLRAWAGEWLSPIAVVAVLTVAIMTANYARWGIFALSQQATPGFVAARRALMSIKPEHPVRWCYVTREMWQRAYAVSPSFCEFRPLLDGDWGNNQCASVKSLGYPPGEMGDWFFWMLRGMTESTGHYTSGRDSEAFYYRIADEINNAAAAGRVPTRSVPTVWLDPCLDNWLPLIIPNFCWAWGCCWANFDQPPHEDPDAPPQVVDEFNEVARRRSVDRSATAQSQIRTWIWQTYEKIMVRALADATLIMVAVLLLRRVAPGWGQYLLTGGALAFVGFSRLGFLTLISASNNTPPEPRYLLPAALGLSIMAIWLLAEGSRLLGGAVLSSLQMAPDQTPVVIGMRRWLMPGRRNTVTVLVLTSTAVLLVNLHLLARPIVEMNLSNKELSDADLKELANYKQLQKLDLGNTQLDDVGLKHLAALNQLQWLSIGFTQVSDAGLKELAPLQQLRWLDLGHTKVSDAGLKELVALKQLQTLHLYDTAVSDAGLKDLVALRQLGELNLKGTKVSDTGVKELQKALPMCQIEVDVHLSAPPRLSVLGAVIERDKSQPDQPVVAVSLGSTGVKDADLTALADFKDLQQLDLGNTAVGDAGLKELVGLKHLRSLSLGFTQVSDSGLKDVAALTELEWLDLGHTQVSDEGLKNLAALQKLKELHLYDTAVSDAGLKDLSALKNLERLHLKGTKVSDAGVKELQKALPQCQVER